jgi:hypothetical protein
MGDNRCCACAKFCLHWFNNVRANDEYLSDCEMEFKRKV